MDTPRSGVRQGELRLLAARYGVRFGGLEAVTHFGPGGAIEGLGAMRRARWNRPFPRARRAPHRPAHSRFVEIREASYRPPPFNRNGPVRLRNRASVPGRARMRVGSLSRQAEGRRRVVAAMASRSDKGGRDAGTWENRIGRTIRNDEVSASRRGGGFNHGWPRKSCPERTPSGGRRTRGEPGAGPGTRLPSACPIRCRRR